MARNARWWNYSWRIFTPSLGRIGSKRTTSLFSRYVVPGPAADFLERRKAEVRRIPLLGTLVNKSYCISNAELSPSVELTRKPDGLLSHRSTSSTNSFG